MKISENALDYLQEKDTQALILKEIEIPTCCSVNVVPKIKEVSSNSDLNDISQHEDFSLHEIGNFKVYLHKNAEKYWEKGLIDLKGFSNYKGLFLSHPILTNQEKNSCC